jgi:hypothetical protein
MRITKIKDFDGSKIGSDGLEVLQLALTNVFKDAGFITEVSIVNSSSIKIGLWMRCFSVDVQKHGYNAIVYKNNFMNLKKGYKRTTVPTWDQRVEFNNILNKVLDSHHVSANIKSGPFTIRKGTESMTENDWMHQTPFGVSTDVSVNGLYEPLSVRVTESEAIKSQNIYDHC